MVCRATEQEEECGLQLAAQANRVLELATTATAREKALLVPATGAEYLRLKRTFHGVESTAVGSQEAEVRRVQEGRQGRAAGYQREGT